MAYTAIENMRIENERRFGKNLGPKQPPLYVNRRPNDLKSAALRFLHKRCEGLRFDRDMEQTEKDTGCYLGKSILPGQIPYNMQMDINRLCLEKALESFLSSGAAEDAYTVYYCYLEIFFSRYGNSKKMVELLSEYEANGSSLLMKHRDHYSHSVYVFALGLAIYETNEHFRRVFKSFYGFDPSEENEEASRAAADQFLEFWGLTSLFHDIGYPFELPFEQVLSYFEVEDQERGKGSLFLAYHSVESLTGLDESAKAHFESCFGRRFETTDDLLAWDITNKLGQAYGFGEDHLREVLGRKATRPETFGYYIDHAYFSAARLYRELAEELGAERLTALHIDALSAVMLHNSLFKFSIAFYKEDEDKRKAPLRAELHPLAWLLMICDELQCWDRTAYGRNSRKELHPMAASFDFSGQALKATYFFDEEEQEKIDAYWAAREAWLADPTKKKPKLKAYSDMVGEEQSFTADIEKIVDTSMMPLTVIPSLRKADRRSKHTYLSGSSFLHFYDFAVALHARNMPKGTSRKAMEEKFTALSLEYQLSTLNRARHFAHYLDAIHCFYTDRPVDYEMVKRFSPRDAAIFAPMEHERWVREHRAMGWSYGTDYETLPLDVPAEQERAARNTLREQLRCHKLAMDGKPSHDEIRAHYRRLSRADQGKDWKPFNKLLQLLKEFDGLRIYRLY